MTRRVVVLAWMLAATAFVARGGTVNSAESFVKQAGLSRGFGVVLGRDAGAFASDLARKTELTLYIQEPDHERRAALCRVLARRGLYGCRVYVGAGALTDLGLMDNLADFLIVRGPAGELPRSEVLRVIRPGARAYLDSGTVTKPHPADSDEWSHPYHGPDNNPLSTDSRVKPPFRTQFFTGPQYVPMPQVAVAAGGRLFKAYGNLAYKQREQMAMNTLFCHNGYNGTVLWKRRLTPGFYIRRNTIIATADVLYLGDSRSCKVIDAASGRSLRELTVPAAVSGGKAWKWMALKDGILYAMLGPKEAPPPDYRGRDARKKGWPWTFPKTYWKTNFTGKKIFGFGKTILAMDPGSGKIRWHHSVQDWIDGRGIAMGHGRIFFASAASSGGKPHAIGCIDVKTGAKRWRMRASDKPEAFTPIAPGSGNSWISDVYLRCSPRHLVVAGPARMAALNPADGGLRWTRKAHGYPVFHDKIVCAKDGLIDPATGEVRARPRMQTIGCNRLTGCPAGVFFRSSGHTGFLSMNDDYTVARIAPMRSSCHDGVTISNGHAYFWPWMCDCGSMSMSGVFGLAPAGAKWPPPGGADRERLVRGRGRVDPEGAPGPNDWPTLRKDNARSATTAVAISDATVKLWEFAPPASARPSAPVVVAGRVFVGGGDGIARALDEKTGRVIWQAFTGGAIVHPPTVWKGRVYVGSNDGWVYCLSVRHGALLWRFRAAPLSRRILVLDRLQSAWPAVSGVLVRNGVAYVAAGMTHYDGTYLHALDAQSGKVVWSNARTGGIDKNMGYSRVSVQGHLLAHDGRLYLPGGWYASPAAFDMKTGAFLPKHSNRPSRTLGRKHDYRRVSFGPWVFPAHRSAGSELAVIGTQVAVFGPLLYSSPSSPSFSWYGLRGFVASNRAGKIAWVGNEFLFGFAPDARLVSRSGRLPFEYSREKFKSRESLQKPAGVRWRYVMSDKVTRITGQYGHAFVLCANAAVVTHRKPGSDESSDWVIAAVSLKDGKPLWKLDLKAMPVAWGATVSSSGNVLVSLRDGRILCFGRRGSRK